MVERFDEEVALMEYAKSGDRRPGDGAREGGRELIFRVALNGPPLEPNIPEVLRRSLGMRSMLRLRPKRLPLAGASAKSGMMGEDGGRVDGALFGVVGGEEASIGTGGRGIVGGGFC